MGTIKEFEDLEVWQLARAFNKRISPFLRSLIDFRNYELFKQTDRSAGSIMDNITGGFERDGNKEFIRFLAISKGSAGELRSQLYRALDRELIGQKEFEELKDESKLIAAKLSKFISYLKSVEIKGRKYK